MSDPWMPGLVRDPGRSAGYNGGQTRLQWCKHHDTAGTNSYDVCKWGRAGYSVSLCQILLPKTGAPWQFCEIDALCADSGEWNGWGPGIEVERLGAGQNGLAEKEPLTPDQTYWLGQIGVWLEAEWGVPNILYSGPQFGAEGFYGHVSHSDIAYNPDGLTPAEWAAIIGSVTPPPQHKELPDVPFVMRSAGLTDVLVTEDECYEVDDPGTMPAVWVGPERRTFIISDVRAKFAEKYEEGTTVTGGVTEARVKELIAASKLQP